MRYRKSLLVFLLGAGLTLGLTSTGHASELVYEPINPSFGGNYYNGQWLLSEAQAQNNIQDPNAQTSTSSLYSTDPLQNFKESLNRSILSRISSRIANDIFGENGGLQQGHYEIGDYSIDVQPGDQGVNIQITDFSTGNETTVVVPYY